MKDNKMIRLNLSNLELKEIKEALKYKWVWKNETPNNKLIEYIEASEKYVNEQIANIKKYKVKK